MSSILIIAVKNDGDDDDGDDGDNERCHSICGWHGKWRNAFRILVWEVEGRRPLGRTRYRWVHYTCIGNGLKDMKRNDVYWVNLVECRDQWRTVVNTVMDIRFP